MGVQKRKRAPSALLANARAKQKQARLAAKSEQEAIEKKSRESGGFGKSVVSIHAPPPGGMKNSPAYLKVLSRCGGGSKLPDAKDRAGAPVKGGYPLSKYPVNVLVDGQRAAWLPDDWAQVIKNTGPGGTYTGWMSPDGVFHYHRNLLENKNGQTRSTSGVEVTLGRPLTALDGINGTIRSLIASGVSVKNDKEFLNECLTSAERRHVLPVDKFHFGVVSARRANSERGIIDLMMVEAHFRIAGISATWYVDADSLADYRKLGLNAVVGGKLTPARNMILDVAAKKGKVAVEVSDDISKWTYYDVSKQDLRGQKDFTKANQALAGTKKFQLTPLAAAQFMLAKMRSSPAAPKLAGVLPTGNATMTMGCEEFGTDNFILGDFFVADKSPCRFDNSMTLKEDYDYTCSHISKHGSVLRCNRMLLTVRHYANEGGAVDNRDAAGKRERANIEILQRKWPGVFKMNVKRNSCEVLMRWKNHGKPANGKRDVAKDKTKGKVLKSKFLSKTKKVLKAKSSPRGLPLGVSISAKLQYIAKAGEALEYIKKRCQKCSGRSVEQCLGMPYRDASGNERKYGVSDLKYDLAAGRLKVTRA